MEHEEIEKVLAQQKESLIKFESYIKENKNNEYSKLKQSHDELLTEYEELKEKYKATKQDLKKYKTSLNAKLYNDRKDLLTNSRNNLDKLFASEINSQMVTLSRTEEMYNKKINQFKQKASSDLIETNTSLLAEIKELDAKIGLELNKQKEKIIASERETRTQNNKLYGELNNSKIPDEAINEAVKKGSFELRFGSKYTNIIGFAFIIISILLLAQYSYVNYEISDLAKTIMFYSSGVIVLVVAEILNKRGKNVFSIGLTSGGISILFLSTGIAYFYFNIISSLTGIILLVLTASVAFLLSLKYDRQIISVFAIVGAYLPIIVLFNNSEFAISALVYFLACNIFSSLLAFKKRWNVLSYFSVILNFLSIIVVFVFIDEYNDIPFLFTMIYVTATLIFYVALSLINPVKNKLMLNNNEVVLLFSSIVVGTGLCYSQIYAYNMEKYDGIFSIVLFAVFYSIGSTLKKALESRRLSDLMYITSLFFAVLVVPMQLSTVFITMAWMIMAIVLLWYASYSKAIEFMYAGTTFLVLSMISFYIVEFSLLSLLNDNDGILYRYTVFTAGCIISLYLYLENEIEMQVNNILFKENLFVRCFKVLNIFNVPFYIYYVYSIVLSDKLEFTVAVSILIVAICAYVYYLLKTKFLTDKEKANYAYIILSVTYLGALLVNYSTDLSINSSSIVINIICVAIYNIALLYVASQTIKQTKAVDKSQEPIVNIALLIVSILSILANNDVQLGAFNTLIFGVIAFVCILQGLRSFNSTLRRFGLGLTIVSIGKFFMFDLSMQSQIQKILSYFVFGLILIAISYLYQKLLQKFEIDINVDDENKKIDENNENKENKNNVKVANKSKVVASKSIEVENKTTEVENKAIEIENKATEVENKTTEVENKTTEIENKTTEVEKKHIKVDKKVSDMWNRPIKLERISSDMWNKPIKLEQKTSNIEKKSIVLEDNSNDTTLKTSETTTIDKSKDLPKE